MPWHGRQKRNPLPASERLTQTLNVPLTPAQHAAYHALGGAAWLHRTLDEAKPLEIRQPCAHQPFPVLRVTDATGKPVPFDPTLWKG